MSEIKRQPKPKMLFEENRETFNKLVAEGKMPLLRNENLAALDLSGFDLRNADLTGSYFNGANLSGLDLSGARMHGASLKNARVSGCLFPANISAEEIRLSVDLGTRLRQADD